MKTVFIKTLMFLTLSGIVLPSLISSDDWGLFGLGVVLLLGSVYYVANSCYELFVKKVNENEQVD